MKFCCLIYRLIQLKPTIRLIENHVLNGIADFLYQINLTKLLCLIARVIIFLLFKPLSSAFLAWTVGKIKFPNQTMQNVSRRL